MTDARFKIVFDGEALPEVALDTVKDNLARLFKSDRAQIDRLFGRSGVALKRDLPEAEADKYLSALQRAGAKVRKEREPAAGLAPAGNAEPQPAQALAGDGMICPKCGQQQPRAAECAACGIIIEKFLARQTQLAENVVVPPAPAVAATTDGAAPSPYAPPQAQVGESLPEYGELRVFGVEGRIGRLRYLAWSLLLMVAALALFGVAAMGFAISELVGGVLLAVVGIGLLVVSVQIGVQRLHDIGWSGWLWLLNLVPIIGSVFPLLMLIVPGTSGPNRFGPPQPPNSPAVKVLAALWLVLIALGLIALFAGGLG
ncbi:MAG: DUF805 domain-containing protein, partial [Pseudomonas sp.]